MALAAALALMGKRPIPVEAQRLLLQLLGLMTPGFPSQAYPITHSL